MRMRVGCARAVAIMAVLCVGGVALAQGTGGTAQPKPMARDADPDWDVVAVNPSDPNSTNGQRIRMSGGHVRFLDTTVEQFLLIGYGLQKGQLTGVPDWAKTERWSVDGVASVEGEPSLRQLQSMMQKVLAERFGLKLHHEQREMPVYALTVAKGGPKMTLNTSDPNGWMDQQNSVGSGRDVENLKNASMAEVALILQFRTDRPVVDQTKLKGRYDFKLEWTIDETSVPAADAPPGLFTAIQEQIGLKLEPARAPAEVLVIERLERPGAN